MTTENKAKYNIGDEVLVLSSNKVGSIKEIVSYLGDGENLYLVTVGKQDKLCVESNLQMYKRKVVSIALDINVDELASQFAIDDEIKRIIKDLRLKPSDDSEMVLLNACRLQRYLVMRDDYQKSNDTVGENVLKNQLYHGLFDGKTDSIILSYIFSEVLKRINTDVLCVACKDISGKYHVSNMVNIEGLYYFFDVEAERINKFSYDGFVLCYGALGYNSYSDLYKPLCLVDFNNLLGENKLPSNMAVGDIDIDYVNKLLLMNEGDRNE